ncbi:MAG: hypothetical protein F2932_03235, partial [Actinobacteria bacterium]|nr:hypothetical protein [Actinomycetota bacterium]
MATAAAGLQFGNSSIWHVAGNLIWSPVARLDLGVELAYYQNKVGLQNAPAAFVAAGSPGLSNSNWSLKTRVERA